MANISTKAFGYLFVRNHISRGIRPVVALIKAVARAFTFASMVFAAGLVFFFFVSPSTLHSLARYTALHTDGIAVWMMGFLGLMALYLIIAVFAAINRKWNRFYANAPERAKKTETVIMLVLLMFVLAFVSLVTYVQLSEKSVKTPQPPLVVAIHPQRPQSRVLLHFWIPSHTAAKLHSKVLPRLPWISTNVIGAAKVEHLGPGHYEIWMQRHG